MLDGPFSAVDAHIGSELFPDCMYSALTLTISETVFLHDTSASLLQEYILSALSSKTVIYVTHQVEFLPAADLILVTGDHILISVYMWYNMLLLSHSLYYANHANHIYAIIESPLNCTLESLTSQASSDKFPISKCIPCSLAA